MSQATRILVIAVVGLGILGAKSHAYLSSFTAPEKCLAGKLKAVGKGAAAYTNCYAKNVKSPDAGALATCLAKAGGKITSAFGKLDTKYPACVGGTGDGGARDADAASYAADVDDDVGNAAGSKCDAAKQKCVGKYAAGILGCYSKAAGKTGVVDNAPPKGARRRSRSSSPTA